MNDTRLPDTVTMRDLLAITSQLTHIAALLAALNQRADGHDDRIDDITDQLRGITGDVALITKQFVAQNAVTNAAEVRATHDREDATAKQTARTVFGASHVAGVWTVIAATIGAVVGVLVTLRTAVHP